MPSPQPVTPRARLPRDERRAVLLDAALAAFAENGYHATAMDDIADRAGVSKPVLYQHFDSKLDLYLAIAARVSDEVTITLRDALDSTDSADHAERIRACLATFFTFVDRPDSGHPLLFSSDMGQDPAVARILEDTRRSSGEAIGQVLARETGLPWDECVLVGVTIAGLAQTAALHWFAHKDTLSRERAIEVATALTFRGLGFVPPPGGAGAAVPAG